MEFCHSLLHTNEWESLYGVLYGRAALEGLTLLNRLSEISPSHTRALPAEKFKCGMYTVFDYTIEDWLRKLNVDVVRASP